MSLRRMMIVLGTRPEAIKLAPVYRALAAEGRYAVTLTVTGQHRSLLDDTLHALDLEPDYDLDLMRDNQSQFDLIGAMLPALGRVLSEVRPECVLVQGDTASAFVGAFAAYLHGARVAHVEAGLRTGDKHAPFPEETYRRLIADLADDHFAPTPQARDNLLEEGIPADSIRVTGNTAIDALHWVLAQVKPRWPESLGRLPALRGEGRLVLVTCHRRESFGGDLEQILLAVADCARRFPTVSFVFPVHPNPQVTGPAQALLTALPNVLLIAPLDYTTFSHLLARCYLVMTDSGGVQEEAVELGKPTLVLRRTTERQEGVDAGTALLAGVDRESIAGLALELLGNEARYQQHARRAAVYGDGRAAELILETLNARFPALA